MDDENSGLREKYDAFKKRLHNAHNYRKQVEGAEQVGRVMPEDYLLSDSRSFVLQTVL